MKTKIFLTSMLAVLVAGPAFATVVIDDTSTEENCYGAPVDDISEGAVQYRAVWHDCSVTGYSSANIQSLVPSNNGGANCSYTIVCADGYHLANAVSGGTYTVSGEHTSITASEWENFCVANDITLKWDKNGANSADIADTTCVYNTIDGIDVVAQPTKTGHTFEGWEIVCSGEHITYDTTNHVCTCEAGYTLNNGKCE